MKKRLMPALAHLSIAALSIALLLCCNNCFAQDIDAPDTLRFVKLQQNLLPSLTNNQIIDTVIPGKCYLVEMLRNDSAATSVLVVKQDKHFYAFDPFEGTIRDNSGWRKGELQFAFVNLDGKGRDELMITCDSRNGMSSRHGHGWGERTRSFAIIDLDKLTRLAFFSNYFSGDYWSTNVDLLELEAMGDSAPDVQTTGYSVCYNYVPVISPKQIIFTLNDSCNYFDEGIRAGNGSGIVKYELGNGFLFKQFAVTPQPFEGYEACTGDEYPDEEPESEEDDTGSDDEDESSTVMCSEYVSLSYPLIYTGNTDLDLAINTEVESVIAEDKKNSVEVSEGDNPCEESCYDRHPAETNSEYRIRLLNADLISLEVERHWMAGDGGNGSSHYLVPLSFERNGNRRLLLKHLVKEKYLAEISRAIIDTIKKNNPNSQTVGMGQLQDADFSGTPISLTDSSVIVYCQLDWGHSNTMEPAVFLFKKHKRWFNKQYVNMARNNWLTRP